MLIACSRATVISPVIDVINEQSFKYQFVNTVLGSFTWKLSFTWTTLLKSMQTGDPSDPVKLVVASIKPKTPCHIMLIPRQPFLPLSLRLRSMAFSTLKDRKRLLRIALIEKCLSEIRQSSWSFGWALQDSCQLPVKPLKESV